MLIKEYCHRYDVGIGPTHHTYISIRAGAYLRKGEHDRGDTRLWTCIGPRRPGLRGSIQQSCVCLFPHRKLRQRHCRTMQQVNNFGLQQRRHPYVPRPCLQTSIDFFTEPSGTITKLSTWITDCAAAYVNLGIVHYLKGDHDSAIEYYDKALALDTAKAVHMLYFNRW